jgi:hypothetical protein
MTPEIESMEMFYHSKCFSNSITLATFLSLLLYLYVPWQRRPPPLRATRHMRCWHSHQTEHMASGRGDQFCRATCTANSTHFNDLLAAASKSPQRDTNTLSPLWTRVTKTLKHFMRLCTCCSLLHCSSACRKQVYVVSEHTYLYFETFSLNDRNLLKLSALPFWFFYCPSPKLYFKFH